MRRKRPKKKTGGTDDAAQRLTNETILLATNQKINSAQDQLSAWPVGGGVIRIQTRVPEIAEAISRLKQTWPVGASVQGGYLRLFHTTQRMRKIRRTLDRILNRIFSEEGICTRGLERVRNPKAYQDSRASAE